MPLSSNYTTPNTGAVAAYHVVTNVNVDLENSNSTAYVSSYLNSDARAAGKFCMYQQQIQVDGLPPAGQTITDFMETALITTVPTPLPLNSPANRYAFAGATIVT